MPACFDSISFSIVSALEWYFVVLIVIGFGLMSSVFGFEDIMISNSILLNIPHFSDIYLIPEYSALNICLEGSCVLIDG